MAQRADAIVVLSNAQVAGVLEEVKRRGGTAELQPATPGRPATYCVRLGGHEFVVVRENLAPALRFST